MSIILQKHFFTLFLYFVTLETKLQNVIDLNDILTSSYMPGSFLMVEQSPKTYRRTNRTKLDNGVMDPYLDGSINKALDTMKFHRVMMNQYMCRSYVADQILSEINHTKFKKRMGQAPPVTNQDRPLFAEKFKNHLLFDEGSSAYQNWLSKSTTLEDIYQNHNKLENRNDNEYLDNESDEAEKHDAAPENYNVYVNGYNPKQNAGKAVKIGQRGHNNGLYYLGGGNYYPDHHGFSEHLSLGNSDHQDEHSIHESGHSFEHGPTYIFSQPTKHNVHYTGYDKAQELADIFEIALTALAYLSFGMFIVHLIMSISAVKNNATTTVAAMMMPMSMSPTATATGGGNEDNDTGGGNAPSATGTGGGSTGAGGMPSTGGGTEGGATATGGGSTGTGGEPDGTGGTTSPGDGPSTGGGTTSMGGDTTGGGGTSTGEGTTSMGGDTTGGGGTSTGGGTTSMGGDTTGGGGTTSTGGGTSTGDNTPGMGGTSTGGGSPSTGGGTTSTGGGTTSTGAGTSTGGGTASMGSDTTGGGTTSTGGGMANTGAGTTGTGSNGGGTGMDGTASGTAAGTGDGSDTFKFRLKREVPKLNSPNNVALNEMAKKILSSIDAALVAYSDDGQCLQKSLCANNKYSRSLSGLNKLIIPVWSLGMSWLSGILTKNTSSKSRIDGLKAALLGLGMANCETIYQKCDLKKAKHLRKRKK